MKTANLHDGNTALNRCELYGIIMLWNLKRQDMIWEVQRCQQP